MSVLVPILLYELALFAGRPMVSLQLGEYNVPPGTIGLILAVAGLVPLVFGIPAGGLVDRLGPRTVFMGGSLCAGLGYGGIALTAVPWMIAVFFGIAMAGITACIIASQIMLISVVPVSQREHSLGWFGTVSALAQLVGPAVGGLIGDRYGIVFVFWACAGTGLLACALAPLLPAIKPVASAARKSLTFIAGVGLLRLGQMRHVIAAAFLIMLAFDVRMSFFPLFLDAAGLTRTQIGLVFTSQAVVAIGVRPALGYLSRRFGSWPLLTMALVLAVPAFFLLPAVYSMLGITVISIVLGLTTGVSQPLTAALTVAQVAGSDHGLALGVRMSAQRLGTVLSPMIMGLAAGVGGLPSAFFAAGVIGLGAVAASARGWWSSKRSPDR